MGRREINITETIHTVHLSHGEQSDQLLWKLQFAKPEICLELNKIVNEHLLYRQSLMKSVIELNYRIIVRTSQPLLCGC